MFNNGAGVTEVNETNKLYLMDAYTLGSLPECLVLDVLTLSHSWKTWLTPDGQLVPRLVRTYDVLLL